MGVGDEKEAWSCPHTSHGLIGRQISSQTRKSHGEGTPMGAVQGALGAYSRSTSTKEAFLEEVTSELRPERRKEEDASGKGECSGWRSGRRGKEGT